MTPVLVSVFSAIIAVLSLAFNYFTLRKRRDLEKASEIARLHQLWWSAEIKSARERVIKYVRDWERSGDRDTPVLRSYTSNEGFEDERMLIGRIAYFFSDLNAYIDEGLASESFAYRLFARSQFYYFSDFLLEAANRLEARLEQENKSSRRTVRWIEEVKELDRKFKAIEERLQS